jgi:hypothetical protein
MRFYCRSCRSVRFIVMKRRLYNALAVTSLVLCLVIVGLWVRSYWRDSQIDRSTTSQRGNSWKASRLKLRIVAGYIVASRELVLWDGPGDIDPWGSRPGQWWSSNRPTGIWSGSVSFPKSLGFEFAWDQRGGITNTRYSYVRLPLWLPTLLTASLPAIGLYRGRRARRAEKLNLCPKCGYDLRAAADRCPECGTTICTP